MHRHTSAWNGLVFGRKRWFLLPPSTVSQWTSDEKSIQRWYRFRRPKYRHAPFECVQRAGDLLYVPAGWLHGVINLQDTVAIVKEIGTATELLRDVHPRASYVLGYPQVNPANT